MAFDILSPAKNGFLGLDADTGINKRERGLFLSTGLNILQENYRGLNNNSADQMVEPANALFWKHTGLAPRGAWGSWSFGLPARHMGNNTFQPLETRSTVDPDFEILPVALLGGNLLKPLPDGVEAVVFATAGHGTHDKVAIIAGPGGGSPLIAHWRGNNPPSFSTDVFDITGNAIDQIRKAGLDTIFEVRKWAAPCSAFSSSGDQQYTIALNGRASPEGQGFLHVSFGDKDALFSYMASGPFIPSFYAKHGLTHTGDAWLSAGGISTNAYFVGTQMPYTAPLRFEEDLYPPVLNGTIAYEVHRKYDPDMTHWFSCGDRKGMWREYVKIPIGETPPCTPTKSYATLDANSNPVRSFAEDTRVLIPKSAQMQGIFFQPRAQILNGRP